MLAHQVTIQQGYWTSAGFEELRQQDVSDGRLSGTGQSGEEDGHALLVTGRETASQLRDYFGIGKPARNLAAFVQTLAKLCAGDVQHAVSVLNFVVGNVFVLTLKVDHHVEGHH